MFFSAHWNAVGRTNGVRRALQAIGSAAPEGEEEDANEDEREAQADPQAERSPVAAETQPGA